MASQKSGSQIVERASGIEPPSPAWKAGIIATIRRPHIILNISGWGCPD